MNLNSLEHDVSDDQGEVTKSSLDLSECEMSDCQDQDKEDDLEISDQRLMMRNIQTSAQFPVSGVLRCANWPDDVRVELMNYHYRGACIRVLQTARVMDHELAPQDVVFDFYLGRHCLRSDMPIRVAWNTLTANGMLGIEFLADSRDFVERAERYLCHHDIAPQIKSSDPLDVNRHVYFKVIDMSRSGLLLSTSLTNKHLLPGMSIEDAELSIPGEQPLPLRLTINNTREATREGCYHLGVAVSAATREYEHIASRYLSTMSPNFLQASQRQASSRDQVIRGKRLKQGLTFRVVNNDADYRDVMQLRYAGYGAKGKLKVQATPESEGEGLDREGTIIGAYLAGKLVAAMELRFGNSGRPFRTFDLISKEALSSIHIPDTVEINRLVVHPQTQGTDIVMGMVQKAHAIVMAQGGKHILFVATNKLMPLYRKIGCIELGAQAPHPHLKDEQLNAMVLTKEAFLDGRFLNPTTWEQLYQVTNHYFQKIYDDPIGELTRSEGRGEPVQSAREMRLEVGTDFSLSLLVNLGAQLLVYGALATAGRSLGFAAVVLGLSIPRRYATRCLFNTWFATSKPQSRWQSWLEVSVDTAIGFFLAIILQGWFYGAAATWAKAGGLTAGLYAVTLGRRYLLRRFFERRSARRVTAPGCGVVCARRR